MPDAARAQGAAARAAPHRRAAAKPRSLAAELASEIEWAKARLVHARRLRDARSRAAGAPPPRPAAEVADVFRDYEREKRARGLVDFDDLISRLRRRARARRRVRRRAALAVPPPLRRRVPGREPRAVPAAARVARRPPRPLRRRRRRPGDLRVRRRRPVVPRAVHRAASRPSGSPTSASSGSAATTAPRRRSSRPRARCSAARAPPHRVHAAAARRPAARSSPSTTPTTTKRAASRARCAPRDERDVAVVAHRGALPGERAVGAVRGGVRPRRRAVPRPRRRSLPRPARGEGRARRAPQVGARRRRAAPFAEHLTDLAADADDARRGAARARRRARAPRPRVPRRRRRARGIGRRASSRSCRPSLRGDDAGDAGGDAVELLTFHRAKGLEFDTVFVTGLERGLVPISHAKTTEALDEEQRLLYVALSRAERVLHLSWARRAHRRRPHRQPHPERVARAGRRAVHPGRRRPGCPATSTPEHRRRTRPRSPAASGGSTRDEGARRASPRPTRRSTRRWSSGGCGCRARRARPPTSSSTTPRSRRSPPPGPAAPRRAARRPRRRAGEGRALRRRGARAGRRAPPTRAIGVTRRPTVGRGRACGASTDGVR